MARKQSTRLTDVQDDDLVIDVETRSRVSLKKAGAYRYFADPSTQIMVASYAIGMGPIRRWRPSKEIIPLDLRDHIELR